MALQTVRYALDRMRYGRGSGLRSRGMTELTGVIGATGVVRREGLARPSRMAGQAVRPPLERMRDSWASQAYGVRSQAMAAGATVVRPAGVVRRKGSKSACSVTGKASAETLDGVRYGWSRRRSRYVTGQA